MKLKVYSIRDAKAEAFNPPFYKHTHGEAERDFHQLAKKSDSMVAQYPEDYDLWYLGDFDDQSGKVTPLETPQHIIKAVQLTQQNNAH